METTMIDILSKAMELIGWPVIIAIFGYISAKAVAFINEKKEAINKSTKNETIKTYVNIATETARDVVEALEQEVVKGLKEASADGKLTEEEAKSIKKQAINRILGIISDDAKEALTMVFGDLETYISTLVEAAVYRAKNK